MTTSKPMLVYIVDSDSVLREMVCTLLESVGLQACALADLDAFLNAYQPRQPGCLLLDILTPGWGELSALQVLAEKGINLPVIIVTQHGNVATAVTVMKQGAMRCCSTACIMPWLRTRCGGGRGRDDGSSSGVSRP